MPTRAVLLDLDGTLVDSVYHHVTAWAHAFAAHDHDVPRWRIHRAIGMGSDRLVPWLLGRHAEEATALSDLHTEAFLAAADSLRPTAGALALLDDLLARGVPHLVATSANPEERDALLGALGREDLSTTDSGDVGSPKPAPDLLLAGAEALGADPEQITMVGDSIWDAEAAEVLGMRCIGVRTGGFATAELLDHGAFDVVDDPRALVGRL